MTKPGGWLLGHSLQISTIDDRTGFLSLLIDTESLLHSGIIQPDHARCTAAIYSLVFFSRSFTWWFRNGTDLCVCVYVSWAGLTKWMGETSSFFCAMQWSFFLWKTDRNCLQKKPSWSEVLEVVLWHLFHLQKVISSYFLLHLNQFWQFVYFLESYLLHLDFPRFFHWLGCSKSLNIFILSIISFYLILFLMLYLLFNFIYLFIFELNQQLY